MIRNNLKIWIIGFLALGMAQPVYATGGETDVVSTVLIVCIAAFAVVCVVLGLLKIGDAYKGIGDFSHFETCYSKVISDNSRSKYTVIYLIIDSNYLSVYHGEDVFFKAVNYTGDVLKDFIEKGEFSARITENGFAIAIKESEPKKIQERMDALVKKLNLFFDSDAESIRPYFHAVAYNLNAKDKNCGFLLYNLRRTCNQLSGSDVQSKLCDSNLMNDAIEEELLLEKVEKAFDDGEFKLYLQFIVDNKTKKITSAEALSRWEDSEGNLILPGKYLGLLERCGLITRLDYYMFEKVCQQLEAWKNTEFSSLTISCNFTRITISEKDYISKIEAIANKYDFDRNQLVIEITEDTTEKNLNVAMDNILKTKQSGFRIALDDMGSGYTSLINLCEYPLDIVKIDRTILLKSGQSNGKDLFIGIISLAHSLNLKVVCEGVETETQNELVTETACDYIQGWYYSRAMSVDLAEAFVKNYSSWTR